MSTKAEGVASSACWFVGATYGSDDQTGRFLNEGIWENGNRDKYLDLVKSIQPGERIAIKAVYTKKHDLPFENRGQSVAVMGIKAIGIVKKNYGDGRTLDVEWTPFEPLREWYFYTYRGTVWRVLPGDWDKDALIGFTFEEKPQDLNRFRNAPYWRERFGDTAIDKRRFLWTRFYEAVADKLLLYKNKRGELIEGIHSIASRVEGLSNLQDQSQDGSIGPLTDICPFTAMGIFNRSTTDANRKNIATELAAFLGVEEVVPDSFEGIPFLNNQKSWFFGFDNQRQPGDIDALWEVFAQARTFADSDDDDVRGDFIAAYDNATARFGVGWNLTMGLYWIRPWNFPTLDGQSQRYISKKLNIKIGLNGPKGRCNASDYLAVLDTLETRFQENAYPVHSFPELSLAAWLFKDGGISAHPNATDTDIQGDESGAEPEEGITPAPIEPYSVDNIISDGCFIERLKLERILERLRTKKNLILQGPPGTGKTWLAKRLAFALIGQKNDSKVRAVQFHPNLSYEDFIRGWRPSGEGKLTLVDGPFIEMLRAAENDPGTRHVVVIEEINRGIPLKFLARC